MKKNRVLLYALSAMLFGGLMSCGSDGPGSMSADDAKAAISSVNENLANDLTGLKEAPGFEALNSFASITSSSNPFGRSASYKRKEVRDQLKMGLASIRSMMVHSAANGKVAGDEPFDYNGKKGVYTYNSETDLFSKTGESTIIKIFFPTEGSLTNNAEFRLSAYEEVSTPNGDDLYSPTLVDATVLIDGTVQAELDLSAQYGSEDQPVYGDISVFVTPYTIELTFDDRPSTTSSVSESLSKNGSTLIGVGAKVTYYSADKSDENIKQVSGHLQLMNIKFVVSINADDAQNATDISDIIHVTIKIDGKDAGRIVFEADEVTGEPVPYVRYQDGSTESLELLFEDLAVELESILS